MLIGQFYFISNSQRVNEQNPEIVTINEQSARIDYHSWVQGQMGHVTVQFRWATPGVTYQAFDVATSLASDE